LVTTGPCDDPALFGERVREVYVQSPPPKAALQVHIATVAADTKAGYSLGPAVFSYDQCSDCWDESIQGAGSVWIYAPFDRPDQRQTVGQLYRISPRTGRVLERWSMPSMVRALLAVDDHGLWIAPSVDTGGPNVIYHIAPGMRAPYKVPAPAAANGDGFLIARGDTVWFDTSGRLGAPVRLWRLQGAHVVFAGKLRSGASDCANPFGASASGPVPLVDNGTLAIYCTVVGKWVDGIGGLTQNVIRIEPGRLQLQQVATVKSPPGSVTIAGAAALNGSYVFLDPPTTTPAGTFDSPEPVSSGAHAGMLFRVTPG
jgi:hypothetical protein